MGEYERVRKEIAKTIPRKNCNDCLRCHSWDEVLSYKDSGCPYQLFYADQILQIKGLCILADDQSLPDYRYEYDQEWVSKLAQACKDTQQDMLNANFKKVI